MKNSIGIIAPATSIVGDSSKKIFQQGLKVLEENNFDVVIGKNVYSTSEGYCGSVDEKLEDIYYVCKKAKYIMCATGGYNSNNLLDRLDYSKIKNNIFIGNSNPTLLLNALYEINGQISYIGPNVKSLGKSSSCFMIECIKNVIYNNEDSVIIEVKNDIIKEGVSEGIAIGGNIQSLRRILGTKYFPKTNNKILYLEADPSETNQAEYESIICQFKQAGIFKDCNGIILGNYNDINFINKVFDEFCCPIVMCKNIGHNVNNNMVPIGKKIRINKDGGISVIKDEQ